MHGTSSSPDLLECKTTDNPALCNGSPWQVQLVMPIFNTRRFIKLKGN